VDQRYIEDVEPGDEFEESWQATPEAVRLYMTTRRGAIGGVDPLELDDDDRPRPGFDRPIVPGPMSLAVLTRVVTDWMGPLGRLRSIDVDYRRPVYRDDALRVIALVTDTAEDGATVRLDVYFQNERGERPLQGIAVVELPQRQ
jgi:acyl dehydratase